MRGKTIRVAGITVSFVVALIGCAGSGAQQTQSLWVTEDGSPAPPERVTAAREKCERLATERAGKSARSMNIEWASEMRKCMAGEGLAMITKPAN